MDFLNAGASEMGLRLTGRQIRRFRYYYDELAIWNQRVNLTAILASHDVQTKHFLDSLTAFNVLSSHVRDSGRIIDVGSGAGFPGLPLKIVYPGLNLTLLESVGKKTHFLTHVVKNMGLSNVKIITGRAETLAFDPRMRESFDVALARAVGPMCILAELTLPFCRIGGHVVAFKKGNMEQEIEDSLSALELLGGRLKERRFVQVPGLKDDRMLIVVEKVKPTPERYPRRPGMPRKRPLRSKESQSS